MGGVPASAAGEGKKRSTPAQLRELYLNLVVINLVRHAISKYAMEAPPPFPPEVGGVYFHVDYFADASRSPKP